MAPLRLGASLSQKLEEHLVVCQRPGLVVVAFKVILEVLYPDLKEVDQVGLAVEDLYQEDQLAVVD